MIDKKIRKIFVAAAALAAVPLLWMLSGCEGTSTETIAGKTTGMIYLASGKPAVGARVRVFPVGYRPLEDSASTLAFKTSTDDKGRYFIDSLSAGEYNILSDLKGQGAAQDSIFLSSTPRTLAADTLSAPGILCGYVALQPGDPPGAATVQILGTQAFANVEDNGFFELPELPPGIYRAAVTAGLDGYSVLYRAVTMHSGERDTLADTLRPKYNGIPQVSGLNAVFDTLNQTVLLQWMPSTYSGLDYYVVYRNRKGAIETALSPIAAIRETQYSDQLGNAEVNLPVFPSASSDSGSEWEYRVAIRDKFRNIGRSYGSVPVSAPPASVVSTVLRLSANHVAGTGTPNDLWRASINDTVYLILQAANPTRSLKSLRWFQDSIATPLRTVPLSGRIVQDTLLVVLPGSGRNLDFRAEIVDDAGTDWKKATTLVALDDRPVVRMPSSLSVPTGDSVRIVGNVTDGFGRIVKLEWRFGNGPWSAPTLSNDTLFHAPLHGDFDYPITLRATDDDGMVDSGTVHIQINPWFGAQPLPAPATEQASVVLGSRLFAFGGLDTVGSCKNWAFAFDTATHAWTVLPSMPTARASHVAARVGNRIFVAGGYRDHEYLSSTLEFDPSNGTWSARKDIPRPRVGAVAAVYGEKIYVFGGYDNLAPPHSLDVIDVYDPGTDSWTSFSSPLPVWGALQGAVIGNDFYAFAVGPEQSGQYSRFSFLDSSWTPLGTIPRPTGFNTHLENYAIASNGSEIWMFGGQDQGNWSSLVYQFSPPKAHWEEEFGLPVATYNAAANIIGKKVYVAGGISRQIFDGSRGYFIAAPSANVYEMELP